MLLQKSSMFRSFFLVGVIALVAVGCAVAPPGPLFQPVSDLPKDKGIIYIYKPNNYGKSIYDISVNGKLITTLFRGRYYPYIANTGQNTITGVKKARAGEIFTVVLGLEPDIKISVNVEAGTSYYVERKGGVFVRFELVPEGEALPRLRDTASLSTAIN
jgi:hypothetical protein